MADYCDIDDEECRHALAAFVNKETTWSQKELVGITDEDDNYTGQKATRGEMREGNLWHRTSYIIVTNNKNQYLIHRRSDQKDFCPSWFDLAFGGVVNAEEMDDIDSAALREIEEEMGVPGLAEIDPKLKSEELEIEG